MMRQRLRADLALGLCTLIWGATFVLVKDALADISVVLYSKHLLIRSYCT
jgi:drug/metabolite transporter (DMT)-like permease